MANIQIITNNGLVAQRCASRCPVRLYDVSYGDLLLLVRDSVHRGGKLLTHPLAGSIKPNETPFRSILMQEGDGPLCFESARLIEESIAAFKKFGGPRFQGMSDAARRDFAEIDLSLITGALDSAGIF